MSEDGPPVYIWACTAANFALAKQTHVAWELLLSFPKTNNFILDVGLPSGCPQRRPAQQLIWLENKVRQTCWRLLVRVQSSVPCFCIMRSLCNRLLLRLDPCICLMWSHGSRTQERISIPVMCRNCIRQQSMWLHPVGNLLKKKKKKKPKGIVTDELLSLLFYSKLCSQQSGIDNLC